jgi:tripartite-type tricarboxylate transporter receptor subunit TctC
VWAPAGTPREIVMTLNAALNDLLKSPELTSFFEQQSVTVRGGTPEAFAQRVNQDTAQWRRAIKLAGVTVE